MSDTDALEVLEAWKSKRFRKSDILLSEAAESLDQGKSLIEVRPGLSNTKWFVFDVKTNDVATLVHTVIWGGSFDLYTGNYVPKGETAPDGLQDKDIQHEISYKCEFSYQFETRMDTSIHDYIVRIEEHAKKIPLFNIGNHPRRAWQDGRSSISRRRYIAACPIFEIRAPNNAKEKGSIEIPYEVHPWIDQAIEDQKDKRPIPNPKRPKYLEYANNEVNDIQDTNNHTFRRGDIVMVAFRLGFVVPGKPWFSEMIPLEFVRVATTSSNLSYVLDYPAFPGNSKFESLKTGSSLFPIDSDETTGKRVRSRSGTLSGEELSPASKKIHVDLDADMMDIVKEGNIAEGSEEGKRDADEGSSKIILTRRQIAKSARRG